MIMYDFKIFNWEKIDIYGCFRFWSDMEIVFNIGFYLLIGSVYVVFGIVSKN